ncbi:uncharacterized protein LOC132563041 [Ylistrum balloti]|uniref:uncharacterized protein LOC132563041 n=1 Tax=Ylistrum balloti TaxID=509963 RepID=UPI0029057DCC|nr:uncharacterized protein LOC132563041 [Ylistrum balloti]
MENWATNTGTGTTVGADGAFERFLTAAIATIITIMFSWRLLVENAEENGDVNTAYQIRQQMLAMQCAAGGDPSGDPEQQDDSHGNRHQGPHDEPIPVSHQKPHLTPGHDVMECKHESQVHSSTLTSRTPVQSRPPMDDDSRTTQSADPRGEEVNDPEEEEEDQSAWGFSNWEEDTYWNINTRRKPRDFMTSQVRTKSESSDQSYTAGSDSSDPEGGGPAPVSEGEDDMYVNREYRSIVDNDGYTNMVDDKSSDSESSDSEEGDYEPPIIDSDEEANYSNSLEPIIEEDSDDMCTSEDETFDEKDDEGKRNNIDPFIEQVSYDQTFQCDIPRGKAGEGNTSINCDDKDKIRTGTVETGTDVDSPVCVTNAESNRRDPSSPADIPVVPVADDTDSDHVALFTSRHEGSGPAIVNVIEGERSRFGDTEHCMNESHIPTPDSNKYYSTDLDFKPPTDNSSSIPESPVRTCAVEDVFDGYISDESCSSASVVTVVSIDVEDDEDDSINQNRARDRTGSGARGETRGYQHQHSLRNFSDEEDNASDSNSEECIDGDEKGVEKSDSVIHIPQLVESEWVDIETNNNCEPTVGLKGDGIDIDLTDGNNTQTTSEFTYSDFITDIKAKNDEILSHPGEVDKPPNPTLTSGNTQAPVTDGETDRDNSDTSEKDGRDNTFSDDEMFALSQLASIPEEGEDNVWGNEDIETNATVKITPMEPECVRQLESVTTDIPERCSVSVINYQNVDDEGDDVTGSSGPDDNSDTVPRFQDISTNIQDYVNSSDDDVEPREYNPYDDDFAEFHPDSDEDSFFLVMGDQSHLRKLDTVTNLDALGLNASADGYDVQTGEDGKSVVFTKTEEVFTDHHVRYFTEDRSPDTPETCSHNTILEQDETAPNEHVTDRNIPNGDVETDVPCVMNGLNGEHGNRRHVSEEDLSNTDSAPVAIDLSVCSRSGNLITDLEGNTHFNKGSENELLFENNQLEQFRDMSTSLENTRDTSDNDRTSDSHSDLSSADMTGSGDVHIRSLQEYVKEQSSRESLNEALQIDEEQDSGIQCNSFSPNQIGLSPDNGQFSIQTKANSQGIKSQNASESCEDVSNVELFISESDLDIDLTEHDHRPKETMIDDIPRSNRHKETVIDDMLSSTRPKETVIDDMLSSTRPKETIIDDISPSKLHKETIIDDMLSSTRPKETIIDDISPSKLHKETVIDDMLSSTRPKETIIDDISPSKLHKETVIDDMLSSTRPKETIIDDISPSKLHKETVIDDMLSSTRPKETIIDDISPSKLHKETIIDDMLSSTRPKETIIDDISLSNHRELAVVDNKPQSNHQKETAIDEVSSPHRCTNDNVSSRETVIGGVSRSRETVIGDVSRSRETDLDDFPLSRNYDSLRTDSETLPRTASKQPPVNHDDGTDVDDITSKASEVNLPRTAVEVMSRSLPVPNNSERETTVDDSVRSDVMNSSTIDVLESAIIPCIEQYTKSVNHPTKLKPEGERELSPTETAREPEKAADSNTSNEFKDIAVVPRFGWVVRTSVVNPSGLTGIKAKINKQQERTRMRTPEHYQSVLTEPIVINPSPPIVRTPEQKPLPFIRQKIISSRHRFLSADNLTDNMSAQFDHYKSSVSKTPTRQRIYTRRETTPAQKTRRILSFERVDTAGGLYSSRYNSDDSFEKPPLDKLHKDCIFSAHKHKELVDTTRSIEQLHEPLLSYGSVSSLVETDIDSGETFETFFLRETDVDMFGFQHIPLQRTASMSDMMTSRQLEEQKARKGRFADRNMPKSKSLMALETNIDEEVEGDGSLKRVPSIHELRVAKSLQKLNVPDWYKKSSVSRSGSTYSLLSERRDSTSTLDSIGYAMSTTSCPCPSISPTSGAVVIKTRVTPSSAHRFLRAPKLPVTPEKSPLPPMNFRLPSDKLRNKDKSKELMPIPVVPFSQLRLMFETGKKASPVKKSSSTKSDKASPLPSPDVPEGPATSPVTSSAPPPILKVTQADQPPTNGTTNGREEETRVKNGRVRISEPEVTNIKPVPSEKPASLSKKESNQEKPTTPTKKGFFSHFKKQKSSSTKSAPVAPPVEQEKLKPSIKPPVPAKPVKSRKDEVNSSSVETTV